MEWIDILEKIAVPRPNHSDALNQVAIYLKDLLTSWGVPFTVQEFPLRYHALALLGAAILVLSVFFFIFILKKKPLLALLMVLAMPVVLLLEVDLSKHVVSSLLEKPAENIIMSFPAADAERELIFCAHYDSKTDFWDHIQRQKIVKLFPLFLVLGMVLSIWTFFVKKFEVLQKMFLNTITLVLSASLVIYCGFAFSWLGGYLFLSKDKQSFGAVDNGGSVVTLLALAKDLNEGRIQHKGSDITILLTSGEEVGLQGASYYVKERFKDKPAAPERPASMINLELVGQNGNALSWERVGSFMVFYDADAGLTGRINQAWTDISGKAMDVEKTLSDDTKAFGAAGIPFITVGHTGTPGPGLGGFHSVQDNMTRVNPANLDLMIKTLSKYIESY
jgi:hypothetical protein